MNIQTYLLSVQNHANYVINDEVFMFASANVSTMTSEVLQECSSSLPSKHEALAQCWADVGPAP